MTLTDDLLDADDAHIWFELWLAATDVLVAVANEHHAEDAGHLTRYCSCGTRDCASFAILEGW